jgi:MinD superfamily P-loop ATPase
MKQLLILSGKGGTGKTTIAGAFIKLANARAFADCDVDAPNLHLINNDLTLVKKENYFGLPKAEIDIKKCVGCDICFQHCRFDAITVYQGIYEVDKYACEGCGVCEALCPQKAISLNHVIDGELRVYSDNNKAFSTAQLEMGSGTSGMLVTQVKKNLLKEKIDTDLAIIDGSPGIGCPVIASISGVDLILIVAEPSISGMSDMKRIIKTAKKFQTKVVVCINKYDTNTVITRDIVSYCEDKEIAFAGLIPFDEHAVKAINSGMTIVDVECSSGNAVRSVYDNTMKVLMS